MLTHSRLLEVLDYDPATGIFRWKEKTNRRILKGAVAGTITSDGYRRIKIDGKLYRAARLAWFFATGSMPVFDIDHENTNKADDFLSNLREATKFQNQSNRGKQKNNSCGFKGVRLHTPSGKYQARIGIGGRQVHIGVYTTPQEAHAAYAEAANVHHNKFARTS